MSRIATIKMSNANKYNDSRLRYFIALKAESFTGTLPEYVKWAKSRVAFQVGAAPVYAFQEFPIRSAICKLGQPKLLEEEVQWQIKRAVTYVNEGVIMGNDIAPHALIQAMPIAKKQRTS
jgi:hypothetical protein